MMLFFFEMLETIQHFTSNPKTGNEIPTSTFLTNDEELRTWLDVNMLTTAFSREQSCTLSFNLDCRLSPQSAAARGFIYCGVNCSSAAGDLVKVNANQQTGVLDGRRLWIIQKRASSLLRILTVQFWLFSPTPLIFLLAAFKHDLDSTLWKLYRPNMIFNKQCPHYSASLVTLQWELSRRTENTKNWITERNQKLLPSLSSSHPRLWFHFLPQSHFHFNKTPLVML